MKKTLFLFLFVLLQISISPVFGQTLVSISNSVPINPICSLNVASVTINNTSSSLQSNMAYTIDLPIGIRVESIKSFSGIATPADIAIGNDSKSIVVTGLELLDNESLTIEYNYVYLGYTALSGIVVSSAQASISSNPSFPLMGSAGQLEVNNNLPTISSNIGVSTTREIILGNLNNYSVDVSLFFKDIISPAIQVTRAEVYIDNGSGYTLVKTINNSNATNNAIPFSFVLYLGNISIQNTEAVKIIEYIDVVSCLDGANPSVLTIHNGCGSSVEIDEFNLTGNVAQLPSFAEVIKVDGNIVTKTQADQFLNSMCLGGDITRSYTYTVESANAYDIQFDLGMFNGFNYGHNIRTHVPLSSCLLTVTRNGVTTTYLPTDPAHLDASSTEPNFFRPQYQGHLVFENRTHTNCTSGDMIAQLPINIPFLEVGDSFTIEWDELYCCPEPTASNAINRFQSRTLSGYYRGECPNSNLISHVSLYEQPFSTFATQNVGYYKATLNGAGATPDQQVMRNQINDISLDYPFTAANSFIEVRIHLEDGLTMQKSWPTSAIVIPTITNSAYGSLTWTGIQFGGNPSPMNLPNETNGGEDWVYRFSVEELNTLISSHPLYNSATFLQDFLLGAEVVTDMESMCTPDGHSEYTQELFFYPGTSLETCTTGCGIPLSSTRAPFAIVCPGCIIPGMALGTNEVLRTTLGSQDTDGDGVATTAENDFSDPMINPDIRDRHLATVNDEMQFTVGAHFSEGDNGNVFGFTHGTLLTSVPSLGGIDELYLRVSIQASDLTPKLDGFDLIGATVSNLAGTIIRNMEVATEANQIFSIINPISPLNSGEFLLHISAEDFYGIPGATFASNDDFIFTGNIRISKNISEEIGLSYINFSSYMSDTDNYMSLIAQRGTFDVASAAGVAGDEGAPLAVPAVPPVYASDVLPSFIVPGMAYLCQESLGAFVFIPYHSESTRLINDNRVGINNRYDMCDKLVEIEVKGGHTNNGIYVGDRFPNEIRNYGQVIDFNYDVPTGYIVDRITILNGKARYNATFYEARNITVPTTLASPNTQQVFYTPFNGLPLDHGSAPENELFQFDESISTTLQVSLVPDCENTPPSVTFDNTQSPTFPTATTSSTSPNILTTLMPPTHPLTNGSVLSYPQISLTAFYEGSNSLTISQSSVAFSVRLVNGAFEARNGFLALNLPTGVVVSSITSGSDSYTRVDDGINPNLFIFGIGDSDPNHYIAPNEERIYMITLSYVCGTCNPEDVEPCLSEAPFNIVYGWNCIAYPTNATELTNACGSATLPYTITTQRVGMQVTSNLDCTGGYKQVVNINSNQFGEIGNFNLNIDLPVGLTYNLSNPIELTLIPSLSAPHEPQPAPQVVVNGQNLSITINHTDHEMSGGEVYRVEIPLEVNGCIAANATSYTDVTAVSYCGTTLTRNDIPAALASQCSNTSTLNNIKNQYCLNESPSIISASLPTSAPFGTFEMNPSTGFTDNGNGTATFDPQASGVGSFVITYEYSGCVVDATVVVVAHPNIQLNTPTLSCPENSGGTNCQTLIATVTSGTPIYTYDWSTNGTNDRITVCPSESTNYSVNVTDANGCIGAASTSVVVGYDYALTLNPNPYICGDNEQLCVTLNKINTDVNQGIIGMDYAFTYDNSMFSLSSTASSIESDLGEVVTHNDLTNYKPGVYLFNELNPSPNESVIHLSIYYKSSSQIGSAFIGQGEVATVCFNVLNTSYTTTPYEFKKWELQEAYTLTERDRCLSPATFTMSYSDVYTGRLFYMNTNNLAPLDQKYLGFTSSITDVDDPNYTRPTDIYTSDTTCVVDAGSMVRPDEDGNFDITLSPSDLIRIERDIDNVYGTPGGTSANTVNFRFLRYVNGLDANFVGRITTYNNTLTPNSSAVVSDEDLQPIGLQMLAADVNRNSKVRSNDITLMQQRSVALISEFPQEWNYDPITITKKPGFGNSLDWVFIDKESYDADSRFVISSAYPFGGSNGGFYREQVPIVPFCLSVDRTCMNEPRKIIHSVLLGDVIDRTSENGGEAYPKKGDPKVKMSAASNSSITIDLEAAHFEGNNTYSIPVYHEIPAEDTLIAIDFGINYDESKIEIVNVVSTATPEDELNMLWNDFNKDELLLTSYSMKRMKSTGSYYTLHLRKDDGTEITKKDIGGTIGLLNGYEVPLLVSEKVTSTIDGQPINIDPYLHLIPTPARGLTKIEYALLNNSDKNKIVITNAIGQIIKVYDNLSELGIVEFNAEEFAAGLYFCTLSGNASEIQTKKFTIIK